MKHVNFYKQLFWGKWQGCWLNVELNVEFKAYFWGGGKASEWYESVRKRVNETEKILSLSFSLFPLQATDREETRNDIDVYFLVLDTSLSLSLSTSTLSSSTHFPRILWNCNQMERKSGPNAYNYKLSEFHSLFFKTQTDFCLNSSFFQKRDRNLNLSKKKNLNAKDLTF